MNINIMSYDLRAEVNIVEEEGWDLFFTYWSPFFVYCKKKSSKSFFYLYFIAAECTGNIYRFNCDFIDSEVELYLF